MATHETRDIKNKIVLEGEEQYKKQLDEAASAVKLLGLQVKENTTAYKLNNESVTGTKEKLSLLSKEMEEQQKIIDLLTEKNEKNRQAGNDNSKEQANLEQQLVKARTAMAAMNNEYQQTEAKLPSIKDSVKELATQFGEGLGKAAETAAKATVAAVAAIGAACVAAAKEIFDMTKAAGQYADSVKTMSEVTGVATQDLMKWEYASQFIDTSVETITGSMKKLTTNMNSSSAETAAAFDKLRVSVTDSTGHMRSSEDVFWDIIDALGQVDNATERDQLAMQLLGKSAQELNPLINAGSAAFKELGDKAAEAGLIMSDEMLNAFGEFDDSVSQMNSTLTAAGRAIAAEFLPAAKSVVDGVTEVVTAFIGMVQGVEGSKEKFNQAVNNTLGNVMNIINQLLPSLLDAGIEIIVSIVNGITNALPQLVDAATTLMTRLVESLTNALPKILETGLTLVLKLIEGIQKAIPNLMAALPVLIDTIVNFVTNNLPRIVSSAVDIVMSLIKGILNTIPSLIAAVPQLITAFIDTLTQNLPKILQEGVTILENLIKGIIDTIPKLVDALPQVITAYINYFTTSLPQVIKTGLDILLALIKGIIEAIPQLVAALPQVVKAIIDGIGEAIKKIPEVGKNIVEGLWDGLKNTVTWLKDKITGWVGDVMGFIKNLFGIKSPSTVMRDQIGKMLGAGVAEGLLAEKQAVQSAFDNMLPTSELTYHIKGVASVAGAALSAPALSAARSGASVVYDLSDSALDRLSDSLVEALDRAGFGDMSIRLNDRELARTMRRGLEVGFI